MMNSQRTARRVSIGRLSLMWLVLTITLITSIASITVLADLDTTDIPLPRIREAKLDKANLVANQVAKPVEYHIYLDFQNAFTVLKGKVSIAIEVVKESSPSVFGKLAERLLSMCDKADNREPRHTGTEIILHLGSQIRLTSVALISAKSRHDFFHDNADEVKIDEILRDMERQMIAIRLEESLPVGSFGYLEFEYEDPSFGSSPVLSSGSLESKMAGDQLKKKDDDSYIYHIVRLQPGRARELLPCFEEPHFRSEIELQITYPGKTRRVIANVGELMGTSYTAPDGTQVAMNRFRRRRPIAINALAFVIQPLVVVVPQQDKNKQELYEFSSLFTRKCVNWLVANGDDFEYPLNELTLTAVPSTKAESPWNVPTGLGIGLIDHKVLLFNQASASDEQMIEAALHIALVVARQLFGNVLVPRTWSDLWITEGLAAYTALKMINDIAPDWRIFSYFRANYLKQALELDSSHELPPISYTPLAGDGAAQATDSKSDASRLFYSSRFELVRLVKGAAIIQMLERQLPTREDDERGISFGFYDVIRSLMEGSRDGLIDMPTLARAFAENRLSGDELVKMIKPWAELSGFPSLQISVDERRPDVIEVKQAPTERLNHLMGRVQDDSLWPTPLEINYHNKLNLLETGQVALLDRLSSGKKSSQSSAMQLSLPSWTRDHSVAIERADDYESIPYYRVTCSGHGMSCRSLFEGAEQFE